MSMEFLGHLNPQQKEAVTTSAQHVLVLAGAGSGKTSVLVNRIAWLLTKHALPADSVLAVTFTNKAAGEMKHRLAKILGYPVNGLWVGTFHGLCHRLLRLHATEARLPAQFQILDSDDQARLIKQLIQEKRLDEGQWPIRVVQSFINSRKEEGLRAKHVPAQSYGPSRIYLSLYEAYEAACERLGCVDFSELILRSCELLRDHPNLLKMYQTKFQAILVDEFQDTNTIQYTWVRLLAGNAPHVMAVGDDDQSIYGWRGAKIENIHQFETDFSPTQVIRLEQNYRSTGTILEAANKLIAHNFSRLGKELWTEADVGKKIGVYGAFNELDEARFVAERISLLREASYDYDEMAILYRSNAQSRVLEEAFLRFQIPYRIYGGVRFLERAEIKDALAYLRLLVNKQDDQAFERIINMPPRGLGERSLEEMRLYAKSEQCSLWQSAQALFQTPGVLTARAMSSVGQFLRLIHELEQIITSDRLEEQIEVVIQRSGLHAHYAKNKTEEGMARLENLNELINAAKQFCMDTVLPENEHWLTAFLAYAQLEGGELQAPTDVKAVHLMTMHAAKGLEFPVVWMVGVEEGLFPSKGSLEDPKRLEEERRLCYVAMTRAKKELYMTYAEVRRQYGREEYHKPSRFLNELPEALLDIVRGMEKKRAHSAVLTSQSLSEEQPYPLGGQVMHPTFGLGTVMSYEGSGVHLRVQVRFKKVGVKWLVVAYARLAVEF